MYIANETYKLSNQFVLQDLYVEITNKCNLYCNYCCRNSSADDSCEMSVDLFEKLLADAKKLRCNNITLTGGEAILHHNFDELLKQCVDYGYSVCLLSNGVDIKNLSCQSLQIVRKLQISLDGGSAESNDKTRGNGTFQKVVNSIQYLLSQNVMPDKLSLKMTITHNNIDAIYPLVLLAVKYKIKEIGFSFLYKTGRALELEKKMFVTDDDKSYILRVIEMSREQYPALDIQSPAYTNQCPLQKREGKIPLMPRIDCKGKVYACQMFSDEFWIGNLNIESLEDIIRGERFEQLRALGVLREGFIKECQICILKGKCGKGCPAISLFYSITSTDGNCNLRKKQRKEIYHEAVKWIKNQQENTGL